jgi:CBS domain-containing protein
VRFNTTNSRAITGAVVLGGAAVALLDRWLGGLRRARRTVGQAMTPAPVAVGPRASVQQAAARMAEEGVGALPVCSDGWQPVGIVTDRDLVVRVLAQEEDPQRTTVADCMLEGAHTINVEQTLDEAAAKMTSHAVRRLVVVRGGRLAGILSHGDLARRDPGGAASVGRSLGRGERDERSAAWLFGKAYRAGTTPRAAHSLASRVADGQLTQATREMLAASSRSGS